MHINDVPRGVEDMVRQTETQARQCGDVKQARAIIAETVRDLRDMKRQIADGQRAVRDAASDERMKIAGRGQMISAFGGSKSRAVMARSRAASRRDLAKNQAAALRPYQDATSAIGHAIAYLDRVKAEEFPAGGAGSTSGEPKAATAVATAPAAAAAAPPPPPPPTPPVWAADPFGRFELRWWDGTAWTEHVSTHGQTSTDPV